MNWSGRATLYHGTSADYGAAIQTKIDPTAGRVDTDFGQGFYLTSSREQAISWARKAQRQRRKKFRHPPGDPRTVATLVTVELNWQAAANWRILAFVLNTQESRYYEFVAMCRGQDKETRHSPMDENFDLTIGPVAHWPPQGEVSIFPDYDQYCFHTQRAADGLTVLSVDPC